MHLLERLQAQWDEEALARRAVNTARAALRRASLTRGDLFWSLYWAGLAFVCLRVAS